MSHLVSSASVFSSISHLHTVNSLFMPGMCSEEKPLQQKTRKCIIISPIKNSGNNGSQVPRQWEIPLPHLVSDNEQYFVDMMSTTVLHHFNVRQHVRRKLCLNPFTTTPNSQQQQKQCVVFTSIYKKVSGRKQYILQFLPRLIIRYGCRTSQGVSELLVISERCTGWQSKG